MRPKWTTREAAHFLKLAEQTLANWRWRGCGPPFEKLNGAVRYDSDVVRNWAAARERVSTSDRGHR